MIVLMHVVKWKLRVQCSSRNGLEKQEAVL